MIELEVTAIAHGGHCIARHEGRVVFVRHALPGERVLAEVTEGGENARFWRADAVKVLEAAADRVPSRCPAAGPGGCGGCDFQHVSLSGQRLLKAGVVAEQLRRLAGLDTAADDIVVQPVDGDDDGLAWRTRMRLAVSDDGSAGLRRWRSHDVVTLSTCPLAHPDLHLPDVLAREWPGAKEVLVTGGDDSEPTVATATGRRSAPVRGPARRSERADGRRWQVSGAGFWQVHPGAADALLAAVRQSLSPQAGESLLDLYAGVGLFAGALGHDVGAAGSVVAVESSGQAVTDARRNLRTMPWVRVEQARVERFVQTPAAPGTVDLVVLDPPRAGAGPGVCEAIAQRHPRAIAYVACDPAALARDVRTLADLGYPMTGLRAFDIFPMTHHVECVATLHREDEPGRMVADATATA